MARISNLLTFRVGAGITCLMVAAPMADPCCGVAQLDAPVVFTRQANLIVWDPVAKIEHFVRNASFSTNAKDLAFIAPTPSVPEIKKVGPELFSYLENARYAAEHPPVGQGMFGAAEEKAVAPERVAVVQEVDVAGFHAVTLKAGDSAALAAWLKKHGYPLTAAVKAWTEPYVAKGWYLTTFKVQAKGSVAETGLVRLSFKTEEPFNPYFVPRSNQPPDSKKQGLDLYFVSTSQYSGKIGGKEDWMDPEIAFGSQDLQLALSRALDVSQESIPRKLVITYFHDPTFPRAEVDDVYFTPTPEAKRWRRPLLPEVVPLAIFFWPVSVPVGLVLTWLLVLGARRLRNVRRS